ncbi:MAG: tripartite tricarboxylate transporter substrate binding protein [Betaproteobacteria bacterium]|nr:tripartite tricarboxylate transporter substrate binding protein [Betaproteobacteria bacterium]
MKRMRRILSVALLGALVAGNVAAQSYPSRPLRIIVPFAAGGPMDTTARLISSKMASALNQPVIVENRGGAGGHIALDALSKAPPDGYTILLSSDGLAVLPAVYRKLPFDAAKDFVPVTQLLATTLMLAASPKFSGASTRDLIALAKSRPGGLNYGHNGVGSNVHLIMELLKLSAGIDILGVPYKGAALISTALMTGELHVAIVPLPGNLESVKGGRLKALAVFGERRAPALPEVQTVGEAGLAGFGFVAWQGLFVLAKTPRDIIELIQREAVKALNTPDVRDRLLAMGQVIVGSTADEFDAKYKADIANYARIVKQAGIPPQD